MVTERFIISVAKDCGGINCNPGNNNTLKSSACINSSPCPPQDCVGAWQSNGLCDGACGGGSGVLPEVFIVTTEAAHGGMDCVFTNGSTQQISPCNNTDPCPVACVGQYQVLNNSICTGHCGGGNGFVPETFVITQPASYGGTDCLEVHGSVR
jgi:hypothetical protein